MALAAQRSFWVALLHDTIHFKSLQKSFAVMNSVRPHRRRLPLPFPPSLAPFALLCAMLMTATRHKPSTIKHKPLPYKHTHTTTHTTTRQQAEVRASAVYRKVLERYPTNGRLLKIYGRFLEYCKNDPWCAPHGGGRRRR